MPNFPRNMTLSKDELSQAIDIKKEFGVDLSDEPRLRQEIGQAIVDRIRDRSAEGIDLFGDNFDKYDERYVESDDFKDYDKSEDEVNMELTGAMLESVDFEDSASTITVSVGGEETPKGYNHQVGDKLKRRSWFGVNSNDIKDIKSSFSAEIDRVRRRRQTTEERRLSVIDLLSVRELERNTTRRRFDEAFNTSGFDIDITELF